MGRIGGIDVDRAEPALREVFARQVDNWGVTLEPYKIYARRPTVFRAVLGMWDGLKASGLLDGSLTAMVNRRVAALNGCVF